MQFLERISDSGKDVLDIVIRLGLGEIVIVNVRSDDGWHGFSIWGANKPREFGETIDATEEKNTDWPRFYFVCRDLKGLSVLRKLVASVEKSMGVSVQTMGDKLITGHMEDLGELQQTIERMKLEHVAKLNEIRDVIDSAQAQAYDRIGVAQGEALLLRRTLEWLRYKCDSLEVAKQVAANTLNAAGYTKPTDDYELGEIYNPEVAFK